jgi:hypothetical protein
MRHHRAKLKEKDWSRRCAAILGKFNYDRDAG